MTINKELLLENIKQTIKLCNDCIKTYVDVFSWHSRHANHHLSFMAFYKDYGMWLGQLEQTPIFVNDHDSIDDQLKAYSDVLQKGINLYVRATNALSEDEVTNAFEKGPADFFTKCGKLEAQIELVKKLAQLLNEPLLLANNKEVVSKK